MDSEILQGGWLCVQQLDTSEMQQTLGTKRFEQTRLASRFVE